MGILGTIFLALAGLLVLAAMILVVVFVAYAAFKLASNRKSLSTINVADGLDERELALIREIFAKQKAEEDQAAVKERMAKAAS